VAQECTGTRPAPAADSDLLLSSQRHDIKGRIYINEQGINAQLSGGGNDALAYAQWVTEGDARFQGTRVSVYDSPTGHAFPRLTLRYKSGLVQLTGGTLHLPVLDPSARATKLKPEEWHSALNASAKPVVIDVRNGYEWDAGRFAGAERPPVESFRETVEAYSAPGGPLDGVPEDVPIMMYCTGGIRCDFYSAALRARGIKNKMFTLDGGVQAYLDACGPTQRPDSAWDGHLFVFDARLAMAGDKRASDASDAGGLRCHCCAQPQAVAPHRNCPNVDCNRLFLVCPACAQSFGGFCCKECARATHVRPVLVQPGQRYARWSHYVDGVTPGSGPNNRRGEGRRLRKQRRKEKRAQEQYEMTVEAVAAAMAREAGLSPEDAAAAAAQVVTSAAAPAHEQADNTTAETGATIARRQRAARLAAAVANAPASVLGDSRFAKMRARMREEAAARLAAQLVAAQPDASTSAAEVPSRS
jgi:predicted sulfurtransferase